MESKTDSFMSMQYWIYQTESVVIIFPTECFCQTRYEFAFKMSPTGILITVTAEYFFSVCLSTVSSFYYRISVSKYLNNT
jgi:integral membrane sensor domain MASE1